MWIRVLTIINTVLLLAIIVIGGLEYSGQEVFPRSEVELPEEFLEEYEDIKNYFDQQIDARTSAIEDEILQNTLDIVDREASGYVDLRGYLVTELSEGYGEQEERAYFAFSQASDETVMEYIDMLVEEGNTINRISSGTYYLGIGCVREGQISGDFSITGNSYNKLRASSSGAQVSARAFFGAKDESNTLGEGPCVSFATGLQLLN